MRTDNRQCALLQIGEQSLGFASSIRISPNPGSSKLGVFNDSLDPSPCDLFIPKSSLKISCNFGRLTDEKAKELAMQDTRHCGSDLHGVKPACPKPEHKSDHYELVPDGPKFGIALRGEIKVHGLDSQKARNLLSILNSVIEVEKDGEEKNYAGDCSGECSA